MSVYDYSVFQDGSKISNSVLVLHLEQIYDMLRTWEGKGILFFCTHLVKFGQTQEETSKLDVVGYKRILYETGLMTSPVRNSKVILAKSFAKTLFCVDEQNDLYRKLYLNIVQQKKVAFKLNVYLNQYNSTTGEYLDPVEAKSDSDFNIPSSIVAFINSL
jgi:hypothetical protein